MSSLFEIRVFGLPYDHVESFTDHATAEHEAERLACEGRTVELHHLVTRPNLPGCQPATVANICRLDIYSTETGSLVRKTCNIF